MKKIVLFLGTLAVASVTLTGCDESSQPQNNVVGRPEQVATPSQVIASQVLEMSLSSPESAAQMAAKAPESVAQAALEGAEQALSELQISPESAMLKLTSYAQLTAAIAAASPSSEVLRDAAEKTENARLRAVSALADAKQK
ncbi:UNVERIFIED_ORG: hypothetical protein J2Y77_000651 [Pseudomonas lini]|uniref:Uncharacterized protein n=1 Tax=Pseudomonas viciae TaxID=2505979 RepID=A0A4P7PDS9_9PSED|nr:hypothetical protein [Pseudomonas viciae]QBZ88741.1 hypothetical protein EPZ47_08460 [Pseudomonas viciae]UZE88087.1 hypothetical protein LOY66_08370 [Pseudomonas viciae]WGO95067.1 hypothetical protein QCD61_08280 [Pseudomonas viciae]